MIKPQSSINSRSPATTISIIIPAYNEEKRIGKTLDKYSKYFEIQRRQKKIDYGILVVINNIMDRTEEIVKSAQKKNKRITYLNLKLGGKGFAVIEGFKEALKGGYDLIGFVDADMATSPEEYWKLIENMGKYDGIIADRYMKDSKIFPHPTMQRLFARKLFNFIIRSFLLMPLSDTQCGAKIFKREILEKIIPLLTMSQWAFDVELLYTLRKKDFRIRSFPTIWIDKEYSTINFWQAGPWMALGVIRLRILNSPFKRFIRVYDKLIGFIPK